MLDELKFTRTDPGPGPNIIKCFGGKCRKSSFTLIELFMWQLASGPDSNCIG